jgi:two-component system, cell cycle response regulator CtrA
MHILVVEDDPAVSHSIELMLRSENCTVHTTDLGEEGLELAKLNAYENVYRGNL